MILIIVVIRKLFYDGEHSMQTRGLLILLMAKAAGPGLHVNADTCREAMVGGIYQRSANYMY